MAKIILVACGSFNPPTTAHMSMFKLARAKMMHKNNLGVNEFLGVISPTNDAYQKPGLIAAEHRIAMCALMTNSWIRADNWESQQAEFVPTLQVLKHIKNDYIDNLRKLGNQTIPQVILLCGEDLLMSMTKEIWNPNDVREIMRDFGMIVLRRLDNNTPESFISTHFPGANITLINNDLNEISSTLVRNKIKNGEPVDDLIDPKVYKYIQENKLYIG